MSRFNAMRTLSIFLVLAGVSCAVAGAGEKQGAYIKEIEDEDGDLVIVMETDWISMRLMPRIGSTIVRFAYRATQNETIGITRPKYLRAGGGLLQDNLWEQDWRFQELRGKWYDYKITKTGPEEVQVVFRTKLTGWLQAKGSGIISKLLSGLVIQRTVTLKQGAPYFLFDVEFINPDDRNAKLPLYWCHNMQIIDMASHDHYIRPTDLGLDIIPEPHSHQFVYNFSDGWSANISPQRKEGLVYLMDYDYLDFLYNCTPAYTTEWVYDNLLVYNQDKLKRMHAADPSVSNEDGTVRTRIYIIPTMGLESVAHANEYFICDLRPVRDKGVLHLQYRATSSYEKVRSLTLVPELEYDLLDKEAKTEILAPVEFDALDIEPALREVSFEGETTDPVLVRTTAFIEKTDGTQEERVFEYFHVGDYEPGRNFDPATGEPVRRLPKPKQEPWIPEPEAGMKINRKDFKVYALLGNMSRIVKTEDAINAVPKLRESKEKHAAFMERYGKMSKEQKKDLSPEQAAMLVDPTTFGYHPGFQVSRVGLTDFPYDYERLFEYRVVVFNNALFDISRYVGMCILDNYFQAGGGLVFGAGDNVYGLTRFDREHPINRYVPFRLDRRSRIIKKTVRLNAPVENHPIFTGVDLSDLPWQYYYQDVELKPADALAAEAKVLMKVGDKPFIVEYDPVEGQRCMFVMALPFGDTAENPGKTPVFEWPEWVTLYANIIRYAGRDL